MRNCILRVSGRTYDEIMQLNHGVIAWSNRDRALLERLEGVLGRAVVGQIREFDSCRMERDELHEGPPSVEKDRTPPSSPPLSKPMPIDFSGENARGEVLGCPTGLSGLHEGPRTKPETTPGSPEGEPGQES